MLNFNHEVSLLYNLYNDNNRDSNLLIDETILGIEEFYNAVEEQSNSNVVEQKSNSSLD